MLVSASTSCFKKVDGKKQYGKGKFRSEDGRFSFGYDSISYWYADLAGLFGLATDDICQKAEEWICDECDYQGRMWEIDPLHHRYDYDLTNNRHGSEPTVENLQTYLEYHAMFLVADDLLKTLPLLEDAWNEDPWTDWMKRWMPAWENFWISDLRDPTPLEEKFWQMPRSREESWPYEILGSDFELYVGLNEAAKEDYLIVDGHYYRASDKSTESVYISSALVGIDRSESLLNALQSTVDSSNYKIPDKGEDDMEIDEKGFFLRGWIRHIRSEWSGIDESDPLQFKLRDTMIRPSQAFLDKFDAELTTDERVKWYRKTGQVVKLCYGHYKGS